MARNLVIALLGVALLAIGGYALWSQGYAAGQIAQAPAAAAPHFRGMWTWSGGFGGLLFKFLLCFMLFGGWRGRGGWGHHGGWHSHEHGHTNGDQGKGTPTGGSPQIV